ncbi:MAG: mechanosensitive ion channel protein MscS [Clostridia bacterium]|jgi:small conductance mechanosensitive channel|nr:mechanosensitive ion channel protein MscS [Clostridia bacterium]
MNAIIGSIMAFLHIDEVMFSYYFGMAVKIIFIFLISKLSIAVLNKVISNVFKLYPRFKMDERKSNTLSGILKSVIKYLIYLIMGISILETLNVPTQPILATAGLGGIAIGFGAQSLVRDVFTGFFILFEDQYGVGDYVTITGITGTVEDLGLRITRLRSFNGELQIIPNGEIKAVTNFSRGNSLAIVDVSVAYESDHEKAVDVLSTLALEYFEKNKDKVIDKPEVMGIIKLGESDVSIRTVVKTQPLMHWKVERELRMLILEAFKKENIEIPYPKRVLVEKA